MSTEVLKRTDFLPDPKVIESGGVLPADCNSGLVDEVVKQAHQEIENVTGRPFALPHDMLPPDYWAEASGVKPSPSERIKQIEDMRQRADSGSGLESELAEAALGRLTEQLRNDLVPDMGDRDQIRANSAEKFLLRIYEKMYEMVPDNMEKTYQKIKEVIFTFKSYLNLMYKKAQGSARVFLSVFIREKAVHLDAALDDRKQNLEKLAIKRGQPEHRSGPHRPVFASEQTQSVPLPKVSFDIPQPPKRESLWQRAKNKATSLFGGKKSQPTAKVEMASNRKEEVPPQPVEQLIWQKEWVPEAIKDRLELRAEKKAREMIAQCKARLWGNKIRSKRDLIDWVTAMKYQYEQEALNRLVQDVMMGRCKNGDLSEAVERLPRCFSSGSAAEREQMSVSAY